MDAEYKRKVGLLVSGVLLGATAWIWLGVSLAPPGAERGGVRPVAFVISPGEGFRGVLGRLSLAELIRSPLAVTFYAIVKGNVSDLKPGEYALSPGMSALEILANVVHGQTREVALIIPEGATLYQIDAILSGAGVLARGSLARYGELHGLEGRLFPDTYRFFASATVEDVVLKFLENFDRKAKPLLGDASSSKEYLILASLLEREIPDFEERRIAAGILRRRLALQMPLQVDASLCYAKAQQAFAKAEEAACGRLTALDLTIDSPYNTYLYRGLTPTPIGNPGVASINAALHPAASPYLYYLSDPVSKKTIFAETFDAHYRNKLKYLN